MHQEQHQTTDAASVFFFCDIPLDRRQQDAIAVSFKIKGIKFLEYGLTSMCFGVILYYIKALTY